MRPLTFYIFIWIAVKKERVSTLAKRQIELFFLYVFWAD